MSDLAYGNIIVVDTMRDAAIAHAWSEYSSISHGIHGLLFEPYHALFAIFIDPLISDSVNVISIHNTWQHNSTNANYIRML